MMNSEFLLWTGIAFCLSQSALFSGLTIGFFGLSRLRLEVESATQDSDALKILKVRKDSNFLLSTLLWGNVSVNVLLALLTESLFAGIGAFCFSTIAITIFGEIMPQAYLSRHAMRVGATLVPLIQFYQLFLWPVAKPTAFLLDLWLGKEGVAYFLEDEVVALIRQHIKSRDSDVGRLEGLGAINFLALDDIKVSEEGEVLDPKSVVQLSLDSGEQPPFPLSKEAQTTLLGSINRTDRKWIIVTDRSSQPRYVLDADGFLRHLARQPDGKGLKRYCHRPIIVTSPDVTIGQVMKRFQVQAEHPEDDVVDHDLILCWGREVKRIITGSDILGRLLRGIVQQTRKDEEKTLPGSG